MDRIWATRKKAGSEEYLDGSNESLSNAVAALLKTAEKGYVVKAAAEEKEDAEQQQEDDGTQQEENQQADTEGKETAETLEKAKGESAPQAASKEALQEEGAEKKAAADNAPFRFLQPTSTTEHYDTDLGDNDSELRMDIHNVMRDIDKATDYTLLCIVNLSVILCFSEILKQKQVYTKNMLNAHKISADFVSNTLKSLYDILGKQLRGSDGIQFTDIRDLSRLKARLKEVVKLWTSQIDAEAEAAGTEAPKIVYKFLKLSSKFELLNDMLSAFDIHIFPRFVLAHKGGCKSAMFSDFDSAIWLTGGYDGVVRIHDFRESMTTGMESVPLAQFVGHKSIVSDVHFTRKDSHILSSSFDRTLRGASIVTDNRNSLE